MTKVNINKKICRDSDHFAPFTFKILPPNENLPASAFVPQDLRQYLSTLAEQCNSEETDTELPTVVILDNLHHIGSLSDIFNGFLNCKYHKW